MPTYDSRISTPSSALARGWGFVVVGLLTVFVLIWFGLIAACAVVFAACFVHSKYARARRTRLLQTTARHSAAAAAGQTIRVDGTAERLPDAAPLRDPILDEACLWFAIETWQESSPNLDAMESWRRNKRVRKQAESSLAFRLRSGSDCYDIDPREAQVELPQVDSVDAGFGLCHRLWRIREGDRLTVVGALEADNRIGVPSNGGEYLILGYRRT